MKVPEAHLSQYGQVVARLARPLADRDAVLWLVRLDEAAFAALESACLGAIAEDAAAAAAFARAYARTHALLVDREDPKPTPAATQREPAGVRAAATTVDALAAQMETLAMPGEAPLDMFTLASTTNVMRPRSDRGNED